MRFRVLLSIASLALLVVAAAANAASTQKGGAIQVFVTPGNGSGNGKIIIVGAIGDYGTTTNAGKDGIGHARLKKGAFEVDLALLNKAANSAPPSYESKVTCSFVFKADAPVKIMDGTGAYKGINGSVNIDETFVGVTPRYTTGAKKGQCNMSNNANPVAQWGSVTGTGKVSFG